MKRTRFVVLMLLTVAAVAAGYLLLRNLGVITAGSTPDVKKVPRGDQEIAWIHAATSGPVWERFVAGVRHVEQSYPELGLSVEDGDAFPQHSAAVPEIALRVRNSDAMLRIRWYKLTSDTGSAYWVRKLAARDPAPLAVIGGWSTDRALELARELQKQADWHGQPPLLLVTTATADKVAPDQDLDLMNVYPGRSFRFCFTNSQMAEAIVDFVWTHADLNPQGSGVRSQESGVRGQESGVRSRESEEPALIFRIEWEDDPFSRDLSKQFGTLFQDQDRQPNRVTRLRIDHSVGRHDRANPSEAKAAERVISELTSSSAPRPLLVLPAGIKQVRRFLQALTVAAPLEIRKAVVVTGDSIAFNNIYRDRAINWDIQTLPVPLVFFCHEDPVHSSGEKNSSVADFRSTNNSTDDLLLNARIVKMLVEAAFAPASTGGGTGVTPVALLAGSDAVRKRLCDRQPAFFDAQTGNRLGASGEYVVYLRPNLEGDRVLPSATLEVWTRRAEGSPAKGRRSWQRQGEPITVTYLRSD